MFFPSASTSAETHACARVVFALAAFLVLLHPDRTCAAGVEPASLSLPDAQRAAQNWSARLQSYDFAATASREMAVAARQWPDPVLKVGIDNLPVSKAERFSLTDDFMTMRRAGVMQEIPASDKLRLRAGRLEREADKTLAEKELAVAEIVRDTTLAWLDRYYAEEATKLVKELAGQTALAVEAAEAAYRSGRGSREQLHAAQASLAIIAERASIVQLQVRKANITLQRWVGQPLAALPLGPVPDVTISAPASAELTRLIAHHPQIAVLAKAQDVAQTQAQLARANRKPDWTVELSFQQRGPAYSNMVSLGASIPLQLDRKNRQDRELSSSLASVDQARLQREEAERQHIAAAQLILDERDNLVERSARYRESLIPLAQQRSAALGTDYRSGKAVLADVLTSRREEIEVRLNALQLEADAARLWAQLKFMLAPGGSSSPHVQPMTGAGHE